MDHFVSSQIYSPFSPGSSQARSPRLSGNLPRDTRLPEGQKGPRRSFHGNAGRRRLPGALRPGSGRRVRVRGFWSPAVGADVWVAAEVQTRKVHKKDFPLDERVQTLRSEQRPENSR